MSATIRAMAKPIDQLPDWAMCCETVRRKYVSYTEREPLRVLVGSPFSADLWCDDCGHCFTTMCQMEQSGNPVVLAFFDLDEGTPDASTEVRA